MGHFNFGHVVFCGQSPYILNTYFFLLEIFHHSTPSLVCTFSGFTWINIWMRYFSIWYPKGQSKNLQLAPGDFPDNMPLCIFPLNNMERSTSKSDYQNHDHVGIEWLPWHVDKVFCPNKKFYKYKFYFVDPH